MSNVNSTQFWESAYRNNATHWDLGGYTPVFCRLAESGDFPPGKMIVPGAGRGYDARLFARHGFTVTAVDFASDAIREMHLLTEPDAPVAIVKADFFDLPSFFEGAFDYVLEYVTYCAIDPARRIDYADVVNWLLKPGGMFIGLMFPVSDHEGGPPFAVSPDELVEALGKRGFHLRHREFPEESIKPRKRREELILLSKGVHP
ncbi:MAG TPA: methyltransferase domain-containing protein [Anaerolineales bacterium]|nr:methyltransferase domain-containing protein [Anaerolineales bacterium]